MKKNGFDFRMHDIYSDIKYPCWSIYLRDDDEKRAKAKYLFVLQYGEVKKEFSLKISSYCDVDDDNIWNKVVSIDFGTKMIDAFKYGGKGDVERLMAAL